MRQMRTYQLFCLLEHKTSLRTAGRTVKLLSAVEATQRPSALLDSLWGSWRSTTSQLRVTWCLLPEPSLYMVSPEIYNSGNSQTNDENLKKTYILLIPPWIMFQVFWVPFRGVCLRHPAASLTHLATVWPLRYWACWRTSLCFCWVCCMETLVILRRVMEQSAEMILI